MQGDDCSVQAIAEYIKSGRARRIVVMCGAGVSVSAGIPDFRTPGTGLYDNLQKYNLPHPESIFDLDYFNANPMPFYNLARSLYPDNFNPTPGHMFIRLLQDKELLLRCYTQNIDTLERAAGVEPKNLVEAHGSFGSAHCTNCDAKYDQRYVKEQIHEHSTCRCNACNGFVKPDIVFFGENLPKRAFELCEVDLPNADLLIVMGTSLKVYPFAGLMHMTSGTTPRLLLNYERVGEIDFTGLGFKFDKTSNRCDVELLSSVDDGVRLLCDLLGWRGELEHLVAEAGGLIVDPNVHPIRMDDPLVMHNYRASLPELCPIVLPHARLEADNGEDYLCVGDSESFVGETEVTLGVVPPTSGFRCRNFQAQLVLYRGINGGDDDKVTVLPLQHIADTLETILELPAFDPADGAENTYELRFQVDEEVFARFGPFVLSEDSSNRLTPPQEALPAADIHQSLRDPTSQTAQQQQRTIPFISQLSLYEGATDCQLSVFQDTDERLHLYRWSVTSRMWQSMGMVHNPKKQEELGGTLYDKVIDVEIDSASMGFLELQLGFNEGDNPDAVAQRCCSANNLPDEYRPQIAEYIQLINNL